ncbi:MAG: helix-turn-helix transcriptional regulator [Reinekea sp.]
MTHNTSPSGLLSQPDRPFSLRTIRPTGRLARFIDYFWIVQWQLPDGESFVSENLPHPCVHLVYEPGHSALFGPIRGHFKKQLTGHSRAIGCRFKPGLFYAWLKRPLAEITDKELDTDTVLQVSNNLFEAELNTLDTAEQCIEAFTTWLEQAMTGIKDPSASAFFAHEIVLAMETNHDWLRVEQVCEQFELSNRQLERLFRQHVGLTPKWVLRMYRLQQIANEIVSDQPIQWADLACRLGYFDQAHCIRDFKKMTGKTPASYRASSSDGR